jgi:hypothetical protein
MIPYLLSRLVLILFIILWIVTLAGCGGGGDDEASPSQPSVEAPKYHVDPEPTVAPAKSNCATTYPC